MDANAFISPEHLKLFLDLLGGLEKTGLIHYQYVHSNDLPNCLPHPNHSHK
jgi:hypothetical protein